MFNDPVSISNLLLYSALGVYLIAFIAFSLDLAQRAAKNKDSVAESQIGFTEHKASKKGGLWSSFGISLTVVAFLIHLAAVIFRGVAAGGRVPWTNMFEFTLTSTLIITGVYLGLLFKRDLKYLGTFVIGFVIVLLGITSLNFYVDPIPLQPALQSWWLVFHVIVAALGMAFFAVGFALSILQLFQQRAESGKAKKSGWFSNLFRSLPSATSLENTSYQVNIVGFIFWTFTLIAGAIWADAAWGRYWGWDTKEVWTLVIWVVYAGYIHARATRGWRGTPSAWLSIIGFNAILFNYYIVNIFFKGLHAYSGL